MAKLLLAQTNKQMVRRRGKNVDGSTDEGLWIDCWGRPFDEPSKNCTEHQLSTSSLSMIDTIRVTPLIHSGILF